MRGLKIQPLVLKYMDQNRHKDQKYKEYRQQVTLLDGEVVSGWWFGAKKLQSLSDVEVRVGQELVNNQIFSHNSGEYWDSTFKYVIGAPTATLHRKKKSHWFKQLSYQEALEEGVIEILTFKMDDFETNTLPIPLHDNFAGLKRIN